MRQLRYAIEWNEYGDGGMDEPVFIGRDGGLCENDSDPVWEFDDAIEAAKETRKLRKRYSGGRLNIATIYG